MNAPQQNILVLGDSHSAYFSETPFFAGRLGLRPSLPYRVSGRVIAGASVAGLRNSGSRLKTKEAIREELPRCQYLILAFGQVDLELGYYHRLAVKKETLEPDTYVDWLIGIYSTFLSDLPTDGCRVALKGVNLTALAPRAFAARYVSRIAKAGTELTAAEMEQRVAPLILREDAQNAMHLRFNAALARCAAEAGHAYFDLTAQLGNGTVNMLSREPPRLADQFRTAGFNHHLADTIVVRRLHYEAAGRVFGLI